MPESRHPKGATTPFDTPGNASVVMERTCDRLSLEQLRRHLTTEVVGHHVYVFDRVDSTNRALARLADRGATEGTVVLAEAQTAGHGRHGSEWFSPEGANLYVSVLFHPRIAPRELPRFAPIASLALAEAVWLEGAPASIKWPNDVVVSGRKLGGVLVEAPVISGRLAYVILGIGVNLNVHAAELTASLGDNAEGAVALHDVLRREVDRNLFAASLLNRLEKWHHTFLTRGPDAVRAAWLARDALHGRRVRAQTEGTTFEGWCRGIGSDGSLILEDDDGQTRHIFAGAVRLLDNKPGEDD
jgi:BirA family transcriptional regulator, biotin operon repressor / biotin---[acetyl-CoA-carboxylase] ligase